jgi:hypothetical protein
MTSIFHSPISSRQACVDNDRELLRDFLLIFKAEFPRNLLALQEAVDIKDGNRVAVPPIL